MTNRLWKLAWTIALTVCLCAATLAVLRSKARPSSSFHEGLECAQSVCDRGGLTLSEVRRVLGHFSVVNRGTRPVRIVRHSKTCSCTRVTYPTSEIAPNMAADVVVEADWRNRSGPQRVMVGLETDDAAKPPLYLTLRGFVKVPVDVSPPVVNFGVVGAGQVVERDVMVYPGTDPRPFRIVSVSASSRHLTIRALEPSAGTAPSVRAGVAIPMRFRLILNAPQDGDGRETADALFRTDLMDLPELSVRVEAEYEPSISVSPPSLLFSRPGEHDGSATVRHATITTAPMFHDIKIDQASIGSGAFRVLRLKRQSAAEAPGRSSWMIAVQCDWGAVRNAPLLERLKIVAGPIQKLVPLVAD